MWTELTTCFIMLNSVLMAPINPKTLIDNVNSLDLEQVVADAHNFISILKNGSIAEDRSMENLGKTLDPSNNIPGSSYMGSGLTQMVNLLQLSKVVYEFESSMFGAASCTFCKAGFMFLQFYLDQDIDVDRAKNDTKMLCGAVNIVSPSVCRGLVDKFTEEVFFVVRATDQSPEEMCSFMFGQECGTASSQHQWSLPVLPPRPRSSSDKKSNEVRRSLKILHLSDTHWDPFYLPGSNVDCKDPLCCRSGSGPVADGSSGAGWWGDLGKCDTPLRTIEAMYRHIGQLHPHIDLIYWTGDLPAHDIWDQTRESNLDVVRGTAGQLRDFFPGVPVLPALGNHESVPVDSFPPPSVLPAEDDMSMNWLYSTLSEEWSHWVGNLHSWTIHHGAYYSVNVAPGLRVISLNMNYCMNKNLWLLVNSTDPADELLWLVYELQLAEFKGENVHILGHIPPGHVDCIKIWSANFNSVIERYHDTVTAQFYGHTHTDEFEIFFSSETGLPNNIAYIAPATTPYHGINPAYRLYQVSLSSGLVEDYQTYYMDLTAANKHPDQQPEWNILYSAKEAYNMSDLSPGEWAHLVDRLQSDQTLFDLFYSHFYTNSPVRKPCDPVCRHRLICRLLTSRSHQSDQTCGRIKTRGGRAGEGEETWTSWLGIDYLLSLINYYLY